MKLVETLTAIVFSSIVLMNYVQACEFIFFIGCPFQNMYSK